MKSSRTHHSKKHPDLIKRFTQSKRVRIVTFILILLGLFLVFDDTRKIEDVTTNLRSKNNDYDSKLLRLENEVHVEISEQMQQLRKEREVWTNKMEDQMKKKDNEKIAQFLNRASTLLDSLAQKEQSLLSLATISQDFQGQIDDLSDAMSDVTKVLYSSVLSRRTQAFSDEMREQFKDCDSKHPESSGAREKILVFGLGTGRSGTKGLAKLLDRQRLATVTHEYKLGPPKSYLHIQPWTPRKGTSRYYVARQRINDILENSPLHDIILGDVWYVEHYLCLAPNAKFIVIERNREDVLQSFDEWTSRDTFVDKDTGEHYAYNHWQPKSKKASNERKSTYDKSFPTYYDANSKREALGMYWDDYNEESRRLANLYSKSVAIFKFPELLSNIETQREMLTFLGIPKELQVLGAVKRVNSKAFRVKYEKKVIQERKKQKRNDSSPTTTR